MTTPDTPQPVLSHADLLQLKRWNTPTIYNGWEQITTRDSARECFNIEEVTDFMPQMGPMVGYAITLVIGPRDSAPTPKPDRADYLKYVTSVAGPKIVVVQDLNKPHVYGAPWGEVFSNMHRSLGCVGTITDGAVRDIDEMTNAGFKALARRLAVGHGGIVLHRWNCEVEVFGTRVQPGQLIHADKHGFLAVPDEDQQQLLEAATFMDRNECDTVLGTARSAAGKPYEQILKEMPDASARFRKAAIEKFNKQGEW